MKVTRQRTTQEEFILERFAWSARLIQTWIRDYGQETAVRMVSSALDNPVSFTLETQEALRTAFGR